MQYAEYILIQELIARHEAGTWDDAGRQTLDKWLAGDPAHREVFLQIDNPEQLRAAYAKYLAARYRMLQKLEAGIPELAPVPQRSRPVLIKTLFRYAAAVIIIISVAGYFFINKKAKKQPVITTIPAPDILPGGLKATLTLADGRTIILDSALSGQLAQQNGSNIIKKDGQIIYSKGQIINNEVNYNIMSTPKGGQYPVTLSDGTKVWLNAASSITYPTIFNGKERSVKITGEVYFEVAKNASKPFVVLFKEARLEVLGTSFNINAYDDEPAIQATLIDGRVKVSSGNENKILQPSERAIITTGISLAKNADVQQVTAWKNGLFNFNNVGIEVFLRQIARWYDLEIVYAGKIPMRRFEGKLSRKLNLNEILEILTQFKIPYHLEGRKLIIE